ncbi:MAG: FAD:protein FMN transferase [Candidatus Saccharicenans sp.]
MLKPEEKSFRFRHEAMSTFFEVIISGQDEAYARSAAGEFFREVERLEGFFSRFDDRSEISRVNRLKPGEVLPVGFETYECLKLSFNLMVETGGAFNVNFRAIKNRLAAGGWGGTYDGKKDYELQSELETSVIKARKSKEQNEVEKEKKEDKKNKAGKDEVKSKKNIFVAPAWNVPLKSGPEPWLAKTSGLIGANGVTELETYLELFPLELLEQGGGYFLVRMDVQGAGLDLDLGAIGKGLAVEKAAALFLDWEIEDFLVNAGGSTVYGCGQKPWPVAVGGGFDFFKPGKVYLKNRALSGSGHEVKGEHIFDPREKRQQSRHLAAWVSHPSAPWSDALSTAFMVMDLEEIEAFVRNHPELWALVLTRDKKSFQFGHVDCYEPGL